MHIRPHTLALYFKAQFLRSVPAKVALAREHRSHFSEAVIRISNSKEAACRKYAQGRTSQTALVRQVTTLMSLQNQLFARDERSVSRADLQAELASLARAYLLPQLRASDMDLRVDRPTRLALAQALHGESHA